MLIARLVSAADPGDMALAAARAGTPVTLLESVESASLLFTGLDAGSSVALSDLVARSGGSAPSLIPGDETRRPGTAILVGPIRVLSRLADDAPTAIASAIRNALLARPPDQFSVGGRTVKLGGRIALMGVVNVTPDSFSDGGKFLGTAAAIAHGVAMENAGAEILDVGGESTRPGGSPVDAREEISRVVPVIKGLRERTRAILSIDTRKASVADAALAAGATVVNDVSGGTFDPDLLTVTAKSNAALCLMHAKGTPETMQQDPHYDDVVEEVIDFLHAAVERALKAGVARERIVVDPGIGFGKTFDHNHFLLRRVGDLRILGQPVMVGFSRKAFLGALTGGKPASERVLASASCAGALAMTGGADILRVHDVAEVGEALAIASAIRDAALGGGQYEP